MFSSAEWIGVCEPCDLTFFVSGPFHLPTKCTACGAWLDDITHRVWLADQIAWSADRVTASAQN